MASAEYYLGTQAAQQLHSESQHNLHAPPQQALSQYQNPPGRQYPQAQFSAPTNSPQPCQSYPTHQQQQQQQHAQSYFAQQQHPTNHYSVTSPPYPTTPPPQQQQSNTYLSAPLQPIRSHSQPAHVRFADHDSDSTTSLSSSSDSDTPRRRRRHRRRSRDHDRDFDSDSQGHHHHEHHDSHRAHERSHRDRSTFLGAGAGGLIGDVIFPGLGTAAGLLFGGLGGRKYADRPRSEDGHRRRRRAVEQGWDAESATFKTGTAVR